MKWKFVCLEAGFKPRVVGSFTEAWDDMYKWVKALLDSGNMSYQILETSIWIEQEGKEPLFFYDARDRAITNGWQPPA